MNRIDIYERVAGKLLVRSARLRLRRLGPDDAHEVRHLHAAINAGNSDPCRDGMCSLDKAGMDAWLTAMDSPFVLAVTRPWEGRA